MISPRIFHLGVWALLLAAPFVALAYTALDDDTMPMPSIGEAASVSELGSGHDHLAGNFNNAPARSPTKELVDGRTSTTDVAGLPHRQGRHTVRKLANAVIDLSFITSPYSGSTTGNSDDVDVCGSGAEEGFFALLGPGSTITIGQTSNTFDSKHTLRYGGTYPGDNVVQCVDDPDELQLSFTNSGDANMPVYFLVDAYGSGGGDFVLAWSADIITGGEFFGEYFIVMMYKLAHHKSPSPHRVC
jgi:hypothetical protein